MIKYINAVDVYDGMRKHRFEAKYITIGEFVDHLPSADVVEVVRCKDCVYGIENGEWCGRKVYLCSALTNPNEFYGDFYCESGERRETK